MLPSLDLSPGSVVVWGNADHDALRSSMVAFFGADRTRGGVGRPGSSTALVLGPDSYFPNLSLRDNLLLGLPRIGTGNRGHRIARLCDLLGLDIRRRPSDRERAMATLVRALASRPKVLALLEPSSYLDRVGLVGLKEALAERSASQQVTVLGLSTASQDTLDLADWLLVRRGNREAFRGAPTQLGPRLAELLFDADPHGASSTLARMTAEFTARSDSTPDVARGLADLLAEIYPGRGVAVNIRDEGLAPTVEVAGAGPETEARMRRVLADDDPTIRSVDDMAAFDIRQIWTHREALGVVLIERGDDHFLLPLERVLEAVAPAIGAFDARRRQEQTNRDRARLDAVHTLVGGIAHDLNNSLQSVMGASDLVAATNDLPELGATIEVLQTSASDAAAFVVKLLAFSRSTERDRTPLEVHRVISDAVEIIGRGTTERIDFDVGLRAERQTVVGSSIELRNVMVNVLLNAVQAVEGKVPSIEIRTRNTVSAQGADQVLIDVRDNGRGVDPEVAGRLFEPFVSQQGASMGTGLGLAVASSVLAEHGGSIELVSTSPEGSTFRIVVPTTDREAPAEPSRPSSDSPKAALKVLVIDDDPIVLEVIGEMIGHLGHQCRQAQGGEAGLAMLADSGDEIEVCIVDQLMPGMSGDQVIDLVRESYPEMAIIWLSGFRGPQGAVDLSNADIRLRKPVDLQGLDQALDEAMAQSSARRGD